LTYRDRHTTAEVFCIGRFSLKTRWEGAVKHEDNGKGL